MTLAESLIIFLLAFIAWLLYQIARQLSYLTGKKITLSVFNRQLQWMQFTSKVRVKTKPKLDESPVEKLPN